MLAVPEEPLVHQWLPGELQVSRWKVCAWNRVVHAPAINMQAAVPPNNLEENTEGHTKSRALK